MKKYLILILAIGFWGSCSQKTTNKNEFELLTADKEFSKYSKENGMNAAIFKYCDDDGVFLRPDNMPIEGIKQVKDFYLGVDDSEYILTWEPSKAIVSKSGDLGYTYGIYSFILKDALDEIEKGTYATVWKKNYDGDWKVVLDTGNEGI